MSGRHPRAPRPLEKHVQAHGCSLLRSLGGKVNVIGTKRRKSEKDHGTHQTRGIPDIYVFLPPPAFPSVPALGAPDGVALWWEVKRPGESRTAEQVAFGNACARVCHPYVWGDLDALIAYLIAGGWLKRESIAAHHFEDKQ